MPTSPTLPTKKLGFASLAAVRQYLRYAEYRQLDTRAILDQVHLTDAVINSPNGRIPGAQFESLIAALVGAANDPFLGLHSSEFVQPDSYSVLGFITLKCRTIGEAIDCIVPYEKLVGDMGVTTIRHGHEAVHLQWHCAYTLPAVRKQMIDNVLASWTRYARWLAQAEDTSPLYVELEREAPSPSQQQIYTQFFGCPVRFGQSQNRIALARPLLTLPIQAPAMPTLAPGETRHILEAQAQHELDNLNEGGLAVTARVRQALHVLLQMGVTDKQMIARQLNVTERTLQRHLRREGTHYQALLDEVRKDLACELLANEAISLEEIAFSLGFADVRSFFRRFKVWTQQSPAAYRRAL